MSEKERKQTHQTTAFTKIVSFASLVVVVVLVVQSCPTLGNSTDCSLPGSSVHGVLQTRMLEWVAITFSKVIFLTQGSNSGLLHSRQILNCLSH